MSTLYDALGDAYAIRRCPDPRIAGRITRALGDAETVVNVGAGAGSYEPVDRRVVAVEPTRAMFRQRRPGAAPVIRGRAENLPFPDDSFDAGLAVLTLHHWSDWTRGLRELDRVSRRVVVLTWDPSTSGFWLVEEYVPEIAAIDRRIFPPIEAIRRVVGTAEVHPIAIPHDCTDGFLGAYWRRPRAYLDPTVRAAMSTFSKIQNVAGVLARLRRDLDDGTWERQHGYLRAMAEMDLGYRLIVTRGRYSLSRVKA